MANQYTKAKEEAAKVAQESTAVSGIASVETPKETQVSVLSGYWKTIRDIAEDVESAAAKVGGDIARNRALRAVEKLKEASKDIMEAEIEDR